MYSFCYKQKCKVVSLYIIAYYTVSVLNRHLLMNAFLKASSRVNLDENIMASGSELPRLAVRAFIRY